jgi:uncharacterized membrane protein
MGGSAAGSNKKTYTILAYVLGWITGLIFLFVGKDDPDVKWNAANSIIIFGGLSIVSVILALVGLGVVAAVVSIVGFVYWVIFMVKGLQGNGERIPAPGVSSFLNRYVDQLANSVH